jgi:hypothetical protein
MDDLIVCDECHFEMETQNSMYHPETKDGDYCFECFENLSYKWDVKRGTEWLTRNLPSLEEFMKGYQRIAKGSLDPKDMENNCHAAANALVELVKGKMEIKLERGHWTGIDVRDENRPFNQHSWTSVKIPDNNIIFIVDPTQWVFTGHEPSLCIVTEDDERYDIGGYNLKRAILGETKFPERKGKTVKSGLSKDAKESLAHRAERDWSVWTVEEMMVIANIDPRRLPCATDIFKAIIKCGHKGFIPLEGRGLAGV